MSRSSDYERPVNFQRALLIHEPDGPRGEDSAGQSSEKYQVTRYSQLSTFGLTFQICEMYEEDLDQLHEDLSFTWAVKFTKVDGLPAAKLEPTIFIRNCNARADK